ncbi:MAG: class I SAM-dependent methyltransferase [Ignavibacteria bacterium]|jgi:SAM-dependent methyltransferase
MMNEDKLIEINKNLWNGKTPIHVKSDFYDVDGFKKGKTSLNFPEIEALGNVKDKSILHLQCHFGLDTLSLARQGAKATGIDLSDKAIETAKSLNSELGLDAEFICTNLYDLKNYLNKKFDIVFTSYGVTCWLPDLDKWAEIISYYLKEDGMFYMIEFHPILCMYDENFEKLKYSYFNRGPIIEEQKGTYTDRGAEFKQRSCEWSHSISEVMGSLLKKGFKIVSFEEFPFSVYNCFNKMVKDEHGFWEIEGLEDIIPMMYSIKAVKDIMQL